MAMKRFRQSVFALLLPALLAGEGVCAQENAIKFNLLPMESDELPAATVSTLSRKLATALDRSQASTEDAYNVFAVRPAITLTGYLSPQYSRYLLSRK